MQKTKRVFFIFSHLAIGLLIAQSFFVYTLISPRKTDRAVLTSASAVLSNPRRSFLGSVDGLLTAGTSVIPIQTPAGTYGIETTVQALFPNDPVMVGPNGDETVASIPNVTGQNFVISGGLDVGASDDTPVIATQSGTITTTFTLGTNIPSGGYIKITIPDPASGGNDSRPDYSTPVATNGFDLNDLDDSGNVGSMGVSGGTGCSWSTAYGATSEIMTAGTGSGHYYKNYTSADCSGGPIVVTIGDTSVPLVNPARVGNIGTADVYQINIDTYNSSDILIEHKDVAVGVIEGVFVSVSVDETLSFTVAGVTADSTDYCGQTRNATTPDSTATAVPWGTLATTFSHFTHNAQQQLTLSTNSPIGYKVYAQESDQMGLNGNVCTGTAPSAGEYTFSAGTCIRDPGFGSISHTVLDDWGASPGSNYGFGYSLENETSTPAKFVYNGSGVWDAKQFADDQGAEDETAANAEIMTKASGPITDDSVYVCFRINIPGDQPAGYYYNVVKYTAVPIF